MLGGRAANSSTLPAGAASVQRVVDVGPQQEQQQHQGRARGEEEKNVRLVGHAVDAAGVWPREVQAAQVQAPAGGPAASNSSDGGGGGSKDGGSRSARGPHGARTLAVICRNTQGVLDLDDMEVRGRQAAGCTRSCARARSCCCWLRGPARVCVPNAPCYRSEAPPLHGCSHAAHPHPHPLWW